MNYLFDFGLAPYLSYSTSFTPNLGAGRFGNAFRPTAGEGKEIGVKFKPNDMNLMLSAALINEDDILTARPGQSLPQHPDRRGAGARIRVRRARQPDRR